MVGLWCLLELATFSRVRALVLIVLGSVAGGFLIDLDHPVQVAIQGKSIFNAENCFIPHGRFMHIPILVLSGILLVCSASFLAGWLLGRFVPMPMKR